MIHTRPTPIVILFCALFFASCSKQDDFPVPEPVADVTMTQVTAGDLQVLVGGFGRVEFDPAGEYLLVAEIEAFVVELKVLPGAQVSKGDVVLLLGPSAGAGVEIVQAQRSASTAEAEAARTRRLRVDGLASDGDVEAAEARAKDLAVLAESLKQRTGSTTISRAPIDGIIDAVFVEPGQLVAPGTMLARIASPHAIQARIGVEVQDAARLKPGDRVRLRTLDREKQAIESTIRMLDHRLDPATRMATALVTIPAGVTLLSGQPVRADIVVETKSNVVLAPRQCVFIDEVGPFVFVTRDGKAYLRRIETGDTAGDRTEILAGLSVGESVVVEGAAVLSDGIKVRQIEESVGGRP